MARTIVLSSSFMICLMVALFQPPDLAQAMSSYTQWANAQPLSPAHQATPHLLGAISAQLTKKASHGIVTAGAIVTYTMRLTNTTGVALQNLVLLDRLPTGLTSAGTTYSGSGMNDPVINLMGDGVRFTAGTLSPGGNIELILPAQLDRGLSTGLIVTNTLFLTATTASSPLYQKASASITINNLNPTTDFMVQKRASSATVVAGGALTYTILITNVGSTPIENLVLSDLLPTGYNLAGTRLAGTDADHAELSASTRRLTVTVPSLAVNGNLMLVIKGFTASTLPLNTTLVNHVAATAANDTNAANNQSSVTVTISNVTSTATPIPTATGSRTVTPTATKPLNTTTSTPTPTATTGAPEALDSDHDTIADSIECGAAAPCADRDGDGKSNGTDIDSDGDGILDRLEAVSSQPARLQWALPTDSDGDSTADYLDTDSDNDGVADAIEGYDGNHDRRIDTVVTGQDHDADGLDNAFDTVEAVGFSAENALGANAPLPGFDQDGIANWRDPDDDGDGILTIVERSAAQLDVEGDGFPNDLDLDSDGDGTPDAQEVGSNPTIPLDLDRNGVADYLETVVTARQFYLPLITKTQ